MAIQRVTKEHNSIIRELFQETVGTIKIVSPFITKYMGDILANCIAQTSDLEAYIITRFYREDFIQGVSDISTLKKLNEYGVQIYALQNLHAKLYLFDDDNALVGSANFTSGGFKSNHELSLRITDEPDVNDSLADYFDELLEAIFAQSEEYLLTPEKIENEQIEVEHDIMKRRVEAKKGITSTSQKRFGAKLSTFDKLRSVDSVVDERDSIQAILSTGDASGKMKKERSENNYEQAQKGKNTPQMMQVAYEIAMMVYDGTITADEGRNMVVEQCGMNVSSAGNSIHTYTKMREGECYKRNMSSWGTRIGFENIYNEYGDKALRDALKSAREHVDYYEDSSGYRQRKIVEIIEEFALKI